jgi:hypothetical protein
VHRFLPPLRLVQHTAGVALATHFSMGWRLSIVYTKSDRLQSAQILKDGLQIVIIKVSEYRQGMAGSRSRAPTCPVRMVLMNIASS